MNNVEILAETGIKFKDLEGGGMFRFFKDQEYVYMRLKVQDAVCFARLDDGTLFHFENHTPIGADYLDMEVAPIKSITIS